MRSAVQVVARGIIVVTLASCASGGVQRTYVAPGPETITSETDVRTGDPPVHVITIVNRSTVPVTVWNVGLERCENIKMSCGPRRTNLRVGPGQTVVALRVEPQNPYQGFNYSFRFAWREDSSANPVAAVAANEASASSRYRDLSREDIRQLAPRIARLRAEPESIAMAPGDRVAISNLRILLVDAGDSVLGTTRFIRFSREPRSSVTFMPPNLVARRPTRTLLRFNLNHELESMFAGQPPEIDVPVVVSYRIGPDAPVFKGRALDADTRKPLGCARIAVEDTASNTVNSTTSDANGSFSVQAPTPGAFRLRVDSHGWWSFYNQPIALSAREERQEDLIVRFTEQAISGRDSTGEYERARPAAVSTMPLGGRRTETAIVQGVTIGGSESMPILGIISRVPPTTIWAQFVVDTAGRVDTASVIVPPRTPANTRTALVTILPRLRFTPARVANKTTCEHVRMQVNFSPR